MSYYPVGALTREDIMLSAQRATGLTREQLEAKLKEIAKARKAGALQLRGVGPFRKLRVGYWATAVKKSQRQWMKGRLHREPAIAIAQRAGILPITTITVESSDAVPGGMNFALYGKWDDPIRATGGVKIGAFAWETTDLFKKKRAEYKISINDAQRKAFVAQAKISRSATGAVSAIGVSSSFGKGDHKQVVRIFLTTKNRLTVKRGPPRGFLEKNLVPLTILTGPTVVLNEAILRVLDKAGIIDFFGEIIAAALDLVAAIAGGFAPPFMPDSASAAPEAEYRKPNYLLWGGIAGGIVLVAVIYKKRKSA